MPARSVDSPLGRLTIQTAGGALTRIAWDETGGDDADPLLDEVAAQLDAYFRGRLCRFDLPLAPTGTAFQQAVWRAMRAIPYGATRTYGDLARELGSAARAVGGACGANPIPIVIPCHRVLAAGGMGGYSGGRGIDSKRRLLQLEGALSHTLW
jgi:methylated-DNA-[protein]-cysteine S-methyltransferase